MYPKHRYIVGLTKETSIYFLLKKHFTEEVGICWQYRYYKRTQKLLVGMLKLSDTTQKLLQPKLHFICLLLMCQVIDIEGCVNILAAGRQNQGFQGGSTKRRAREPRPYVMLISVFPKIYSKTQKYVDTLGNNSLSFAGGV